MSDEKKPFAEVRIERGEDDEMTSMTLIVDGKAPKLQPGTLASANHIAAFLNAAVEAREAKLRGALEALADDAEAAIQLGDNDEGDAARSDCERRIEEARDALAGTSPDYVPRAELDAVKAKLEGAWAVLADALNEEGGKFSPQAMALFEALGLKPKDIGAGIPVDLKTVLSVGGVKVTVDSIDMQDGPYSTRVTMVAIGDPQLYLSPLRGLDIGGDGAVRVLATAAPEERARCLSHTGIMSCELLEGHRGMHRQSGHRW